MVHQDGSIFHVKDSGNFVTHLSTNLTDVRHIRSFTCDTIPFSVRNLDSENTYNPQEILSQAYLIIQQPF